MLCDLPADWIYETRGAAMSSTAAATGLFLFLLSLPGIVFIQFMILYLKYQHSTDLLYIFLV